jgi:D-3-phosphoglycerate dehydrogenase
MNDPVHALILDLLEWIGPRPRPYAEVIEVWRTSCPRLPVWEEATARELIELRAEEKGALRVFVTPLGRELLNTHRGV